jgi:hypothetical protein
MLCALLALQWTRYRQAVPESRLESVFEYQTNVFARYAVHSATDIE